LLLVAELSGNGAVLVTVYKWQGGATGTLNTGITIANARCDPTQNQMVCGTLNFVTSIPLYFPAGTTAMAPITTFFEGAVNLNLIFGGTPPCFSSFMIETRSSTSSDATLKDFVLTSFNLCASSTTISCPQLVVFGTSFKATVTVVVTNSGAATLNNVQVIPVSPATTLTDTPTFLNIAPGQQGVFTLTYAVTDASQNFPVSVQVTYGGNVLPAETLSTSCALLALPSVVITKDCSVAFKDGDANSNGKLYIQITSSGTVTNTGNVALTGISLTDSRTDGSNVNTFPLLKSAASGGTTITTLAAGAVGYWSETYIPVKANSASSSPSCLTFSDTIAVTAVSSPGGITVGDTDGATCSPCS